METDIDAENRLLVTRDGGWAKWAKVVERYKHPITGPGDVMYSLVTTVNNIF